MRHLQLQRRGQLLLGQREVSDGVCNVSQVHPGLDPKSHVILGLGEGQRRPGDASGIVSPADVPIQAGHLEVKRCALDSHRA